MINSSLRYKLLIEQEDKALWRVVARRLTPNGFSGNNYLALSAHIPDLVAARQEFNTHRTIVHPQLHLVNGA